MMHSGAFLRRLIDSLNGRTEGSSTARKAKQNQLKFRKSLDLDFLENRELLAIDVVVGDLLFRGDLIADAEIYRANSRPIQVGYNPTQGELFRPLVTMTGDVTIDPLNERFGFRGVASFPGQSDPVNFWQNGSSVNYNVSALAGAGINISGNAFAFGDLTTTAATLVFLNPNGGDTSDANIRMTGAGRMGFGNAVDGTKSDSPLEIGTYAITVAGPGTGEASGSVTGSLFVTGTQWALRNNALQATITGGVSTVTIYGEAEATIRTDVIPARLDEAGVKVVGGAIQPFSARVNGNMSFAGSAGTIHGTLSYSTEGLSFEGSGSSRSGTFQASLDTLKFTLKNNALTTLESPQITLFPGWTGAVLSIFPALGGAGLLAGSGMGFSFDLAGHLRLEDGSSTESFAITGRIGISWTGNIAKMEKGQKQARLTLELLNDGLVIRNGAIEDYEIQANGLLVLGNSEKLWKVEARDVTIFRVAGEGAFGGFGSIAIDHKDTELVFSLGESKEEPGIYWVNGELRRVDASINLTNSDSGGMINFGGLRLAINNLGLLYTASEGVLNREWSVYGELSFGWGGAQSKELPLIPIRNRNGSAVVLNLGTRSNPGMQFLQEWNQDKESWLTEFKLNQTRISLFGLRLGPLDLSRFELEFSYSRLNGFLVDHAALEFGWKGLILGGSITFKSGANSLRVLDAFSVRVGTDPESGRLGIKVFKGVYLYDLRGSVSNMTEGWSNLMIHAQATFIVGTRIPGSVPTYTTAVVGAVTIDLSRSRVEASVNVYFGAKYTAEKFLVGLNPWKGEWGELTGRMVMDWSNGFDFSIDMQGNFIQLITGEFQLKVNNEGIMFYAMARIRPVRGERFDFWPVNWINIEGAVLYMNTTQVHFVAAWVRIDLFIWRTDVGVMFDFWDSRVQVLWGSDINRLNNQRTAFFNGTGATEQIITQPYSIIVNNGDQALSSSAIKAVIPFSTRRVRLHDRNREFAALTANDISVNFDRAHLFDSTSGWHDRRDVALLRLINSITFTTEIQVNPATSDGVATGSITIWVYPNRDSRLDFSRNFSRFSSMQFDFNVSFRNNTFLAYAGDDTAAYWRQINSDISSLSSLDSSNRLVWNRSQSVRVDGKQYPLVPDLMQSHLIAPPTIGFQDNQLVTRKINSFTNETTFSLRTNLSRETIEKGTVSLMVVEEDHFLPYRWAVMQTGRWTPATGESPFRWVADGQVVEKDSFSPFEIRNGRAETRFEGSFESLFQDVLFFDPGKTVRTGGITGLSTEGTVRISTRDGQFFNIAREFIKPLWIQKARVKLTTSETTVSTTSQGNVFTAVNFPGGYSEPRQGTTGRDFYELFQVRERINWGQILPEAGSVFSPTWFKLPILPNAVSQMRMSASDNPANRYFPINSEAGLNVMPQGELVHLLALNGQNLTDASSLIQLKDLTQTANGTTVRMTWSERGMTPTPKYAFLMVNDEVNMPVYSTFNEFTPIVDVMGRLVLDQGDGRRVPEAGRTVFIDTNNNGTFESPEPYVDENENGIFDLGEAFADLNANGRYDAEEEPNFVTDSQGAYYFYDVRPGVHRIGFVLPANLAPVSGGQPFATIVRGSEATTTVPDFAIANVYPTLTGRVVVDTNQNGIADNDEKGLPLAYVVVTGAAGQQIRVLTDLDGNYTIPVTDPAFGSRVTVAIAGDGLDPNLLISSTDPARASVTVQGLDYARPTVFRTDFHVQSMYEFNFDSGIGFLQNIANFFQLFTDGRFTGVRFRTGDFEFIVDRFRLMPFTLERQGVESASGRVMIAGQTLNFRLDGPEGLVSTGQKLQSLNLSLSGDFNIFGARLNLNGLRVIYTAADDALGRPARFSLTGNTTLDIDGNFATVSLPGNGLVLSNGEVESLDIRLLGGLKIGGQLIDLGSLSASYNRQADRLTLTGATNLLTFGSRSEGNFIGLQNVVMQIGQMSTLEKARILSLQATVAGGLAIEGASFTVNALSVQYSPETDTLNITGRSTLAIGNSVLNVNLPSPGIQVANGAVNVLATASGELNLESFRFSLDSALVRYTGDALRFAVNGSFFAGDTQLAMAGGEVSWRNGELAQISGRASGLISLGASSFEFQGLEASYTTVDQSLNLAGSIQLSLIENPATSRILRVRGTLGLVKGLMTRAAGVIENGEWTPFDGLSISLQSLSLAYRRDDESFALSGQASVNLLGSVVAFSMMSPGIVWRNGAFSSFGGGITGSIPLEKQSAGRTRSELYARNVGFLYETEGSRLTLHGTLGMSIGSVGGGSIQTDSRGIIIDAGGLQRFSLFVSAGLNFGEPFEDTNGDFIRQENERFTDKNGNNRYDLGFAISVSQAGLTYTPAVGESPYELLVSGRGRLGFGSEILGDNSQIGFSVEFADPGIRIRGGRVEDFSVAVAGNARLSGLSFSADVGVGARWISAEERLDLWGGMGVNIAGQPFGLEMGSSNSPGMTFVNHELNRLNAGISGSLNLVDVGFSLRNAGLTWNRNQQTWGLFGGIRIQLGVWVEASLGSQIQPGLMVDTSDPENPRWNLNQLSLGFGSLNLGGLNVQEVHFSFSTVNDIVTVDASCGISFNGWGLAGRLSFRNGVISQIFVQASGLINIPGTPVFINRFSGTIENVDFENLSNLTFRAMVGINLGGEVDLTGVPLLSGRYGLAQFNGTAIVSAGGMELRADAYLLARETGSVGNSSWTGLAAQGTAGVTLNWAENRYFADLDVTMPSLAGALFTSRMKGRMGFDGTEMGFSLYGSSTLKLAEFIPLIGGTVISSAAFLMEVYPGRQNISFTTWFSYLDPFAWFAQKKWGVQWDIWNNQWLILDDAAVRSTLSGHMAAADFKPLADMPTNSVMTLASLPLPAVSGITVMKEPMLVNDIYIYNGQSSPVPDNDTTDGLISVSFQVAGISARRNYKNWLGNVSLRLNTLDGVRFEPMAPNFDPETGKGTISVRALPLSGQYLPRGAVLSARLLSPVRLLPQSNSSEFSLRLLTLSSVWKPAFEYGGAMPGIGTDPFTGLPLKNLNVRRASYSIEFKPVNNSDQPLPADWLESIRISVNSIPGIKTVVGRPSFNPITQIGTVNVELTPSSREGVVPLGVVPAVFVRSKIPLSGKGGIGLPDVSARWLSDPTEINRPSIPQVISSASRITTLSGRVTDPRIKNVTVALLYSSDPDRYDQHAVTLINGNLAMELPVAVGDDGHWSIDIAWNPSIMPSGPLWLYGMVKDKGSYQPVFSESTAFNIQHDIEGTVSSPAPIPASAKTGGQSAGTFSQTLTSPLAGVRVYADINNNGREDRGEPATVTDSSGNYFLNVPDRSRPITVVFDTPRFFAPALGQSARQTVDISESAARVNLNVVATSTILSGKMKVEGLNGQAVGGVGLIVTGPDARIYRATTDIEGQFAVPVDLPGSYRVRLDNEKNLFYNFRVRPIADSFPDIIQVAGGAANMIDLGELTVKSEATVTEEFNVGRDSLPSLVSEANSGYVTNIIFAPELKGRTIRLSGAATPKTNPDLVWDADSLKWVESYTKDKYSSERFPVERVLFGPTTFVIQQNLNIDGGNLGITLEGDGSSRAFLVRPGVAFGLSNLAVKGFGATGTNGAPGFSGMAGSALGAEGGGAGLGGAILNMGTTMVNNVDFISNKATGGKGGSIPVAATGLSMVENGISNNGSGGQFGGQGGKAYPVTLTYTRAGDTTARTTTVEIPGAGGGGSGLGGAIFNANAESVLKIQGNTRFISNQVIDGQGGTSPDYLTNLASAILGDDAITLTVSGFNESSLSRAQNGKALGAAIFNNGGVVQFDGLPGTDLEAPARMTLTNSRIAENNAPGAVVGSFLAGSQPADEGTVYSLVEGSGSDGNSAFAIVNQQLLAIRSLNCELKNRYSIRVRATGNNGLYTEKTFTISVVDRVESLRPLLNLPKSFVVQGDKTSALVLPDTPFSDLVARSSQIFTVTLRVRAGSLAASLTSDVAVSGTPTNLSFKGTLSALNSYFTAPEGRVRYTPLALSRQSRLIQFRLSKSIGLNTYSTTSQARININSDRIPAQLQMTTNSLSRPGSLIPKGQ